MGYSSMTICVLVILAQPKLICGHPATDNGGSVFNMLESRISKLEDFLKSKAISMFIQQRNLSISVKSRQRRLSDQRLAELETLMSLSKLFPQSLAFTASDHGQPDPMIIGRRRRFTMNQTTTELISIKAKHIENPAHPLNRRRKNAKNQGHGDEDHIFL